MEYVMIFIRIEELTWLGRSIHYVHVQCAQHSMMHFVFFSVKSHHALVKHLKLGQNHEDFELKKLLINILVSLSKDSAVIPVSEQQPI